MNMTCQQPDLHHSPVRDLSLKSVIKVIQKQGLTQDLDKVRDLAVNLLLVRSGVKPAVLVDFFNIQTARLINVAQQILDNGVLLRVCEDYFVVERSRFLQHLQESVDRPPAYLDITYRQARSLDTDNKHEIQSFIRYVMECMNNTEGPLIETGPDQDLNLCTVFGIFLGYPVVYWFDIAKECVSLNNQDLVVVSIKYQGSPITSFSVPHSIFQQNTEIREAVNLWIKSMSGKSVVEDTRVMLSETVRLCDLNLELELDTRLVNLPAVML